LSAGGCLPSAQLLTRQRALLDGYGNFSCTSQFLAWRLICVRLTETSVCANPSREPRHVFAGWTEFAFGDCVDHHRVVWYRASDGGADHLASLLALAATHLALGI